MRIRHRRFMNDSMITIRQDLSFHQSLVEEDPSLVDYNLRTAVYHIGFDESHADWVRTSSREEKLALLEAEYDVFAYFMRLATNGIVEPTKTLRRPDKDQLKTMLQRRIDRIHRDAEDHPRYLKQDFVKKELTACQDYIDRADSEWFDALPLELPAETN